MRRFGLVVLLAGFGCAEDSGALSDGTGLFSVTSLIDFGQVALDGERRIEIDIAADNGWSGDLQLRLPLNEPGRTPGFSVSSTDLRLDGDTQSVEIVFSPTEEVDTQGILPIACGDDECLAEVALRGEGVALVVESDVEFLDFGTLQGTCSRELTATFTNRSAVDVAFDLLTSTARFTTAEVPAVLRPSQSVAVGVSFDGPPEDGDYTDVLLARISADGRAEEVPVNLVGRTNARGDSCN